MGDAHHLIQDGYAHTTRDGGNGAITHIQCFTCEQGDHSHPDYEQVYVLGPQAEGAVEATAAFLTLMQGAGKMSDGQFSEAFDAFVSKYFATKK
jgi:hypothetical protein